VSKEFNQKVVNLGTEVFSSLGEVKLSTFNPRFWNGKLMEWSMTRPEFKVNLFRLVDVLPTLTSPKSVAEHVRQYLGPTLGDIHPSLEWAVGLTKNNILAAITSFFVHMGVRQMAGMFIAGNTPQRAAPVLRALRRKGFCFTVDLLGEFCLCEKEAEEYLNRYLEALDVFGTVIPSWSERAPLLEGHPGELSPICISVKLSALYSQTGVLNFERTVTVLSQHLITIARKAKAIGALLYVDAEDTGNNAMIYEAFMRVFGSDEFKDFPYPGIVVQAYSRSSEEKIRSLLAFAATRGNPIAVRLVKGAYWDLERVISAQNHWAFPLWSKKESSDAHYEHLSRILLNNHYLCLPAFGSHNIRSLAHACCYAEELGLSKNAFEIQVLYGMAEPIARVFADRGNLVRMYVPLGELLPGMGYLVRRLLENTSNESFLRHTFFDEDEVSNLLKQPIMQLHDLISR
jgi:RHH-type proline utilization regulon transcriptional repressor/proline dehydrogenase/delta 1-pyrroline-5-carboxylate dehydrogenase